MSSNREILVYSTARLELFNYYLKTPSHINVRLYESSTTTHNSITNLNITLVTMVKFIWNELFTSWDRMMFEFSYPKEFNNKYFEVYTKDNVSLLSPKYRKIYKDLYTLLDTSVNETYIYLIDYVTTLYNKLSIPLNKIDL